jgi:hypothetical protein
MSITVLLMMVVLVLGYAPVKSPSSNEAKR